jgi:ribonuclease VapC
MSKYVLDASAILALLNEETSADKVESVLPFALVSAVNLAEVITRLSLVGMPEDRIHEALALLRLDVALFDSEQAFRSGLLATHTHGSGLSLGDRACLTLALERNAVVVTADKIWLDLSIGAEVMLIR